MKWVDKLIAENKELLARAERLERELAGTIAVLASVTKERDSGRSRRERAEEALKFIKERVEQDAEEHGRPTERMALAVLSAARRALGGEK